MAKDDIDPEDIDDIVEIEGEDDLELDEEFVEDALDEDADEIDGDGDEEDMGTTVVRKAGKSASDDPDLAGLSAQQLPAVRQFIGRLKEEKNVEALKARLKQMEEQSGKADAKNQQFLNILKKKTAERIAELEKK